MKPRSAADVRRALEKIGYDLRKSRGPHHRYEYFHTDGVKRATVSVPKGRREMKRGTLDGIRSRTHLDRQRFDAALECPFRMADYVEFMDRYMKSGKV